MYRAHLGSVILKWVSASGSSSSSDISVFIMSKAIRIVRHYLGRAMLPQLKCTYNSLEDLTKTLIHFNESEVDPRFQVSKKLTSEADGAAPAATRRDFGRDSVMKRN